jgi:hypothetical protein
MGPSVEVQLVPVFQLVEALRAFRALCCQPLFYLLPFIGRDLGGERAPAIALP